MISLSAFAHFPRWQGIITILEPSFNTPGKVLDLTGRDLDLVRWLLGEMDARMRLHCTSSQRLSWNRSLRIIDNSANATHMYLRRPPRCISIGLCLSLCLSVYFFLSPSSSLLFCLRLTLSVTRLSVCLTFTV